MLFADRFEAAFLGIGTQFNSEVAVYDRDLVLLEALEYFEFNIQGAYVGTTTPVFLARMSQEAAEEMQQGLEDEDPTAL